MLKCIIIEDEPLSAAALEDLLKDNFEDIKIQAVAHNGNEGIIAIKKLKPHLIFLDVEMPGMSGFEMLSQITDINFEVIFTTGHDKYLMQAIRSSALDYLLKPVELDDLRTAIEKARKRQTPDNLLVPLLLNNTGIGKRRIARIALPTMEGYLFVNVDEIIHCDADDNNTMIHFADGHKMLITKTLKDLEELLEGNDFCRIHHSHLVNINHIRKYVRGNAGYVVMTNGASVNVSRSRKEQFLKQVAHL
jgi:two-component system LytT family response regulator